MGNNFDKEMLDVLGKVWEKYPTLRFNQLLYILQTEFDDGKWCLPAENNGNRVSVPDLFNAPDEDFKGYLQEVLANGIGNE